MAFSMHSYTNKPDKKNRLLIWLTAGLMLLLSLPAVAEQPAFNIKHAELVLIDDVYHVNARLEYRFSEEALDALNNGVPLIILLNIEVEKQRSWWLNKTIANLEQGYLLLYHALSEKFIVHNLNSGTQENYSSLHGALSALGNLQQLPILDARLLEKDAKYIFKLRSKLDIESLPAPMRPLAYISSQWQLESDWYTWKLNQ
jgi:hypothetical protein